MTVIVQAMPRGVLHTEFRHKQGDAAILVLEDEPEREPKWLVARFPWRLAVGFRDINDADLNIFERVQLRLGAVPEEPGGMPRNAITRAHARRIASFGKQLAAREQQPEHLRLRRVLVACEYGRSRSVAIARSLATRFGWEFESSYAGNVRVLRLLSEALHAD